MSYSFGYSFPMYCAAQGHLAAGWSIWCKNPLTCTQLHLRFTVLLSHSHLTICWDLIVLERFQVLSGLISSYEVIRTSRVT